MIRKYILPVVLLIIAVLSSQLRETTAQKSSETTSCQSTDLGSAGLNKIYPTKTGGPSDCREQSPIAVDIESSAILSLVADLPQQRSQRGGERRGSEQIRRRPWSEQISTEELLEFLEKHEPGLAGRLKKLQEEHLRFFSDQVNALKELYGPVIQQMKRDPEAGKLSLEKIRLRLRILRAIYEVKRSSIPERRDEAKKELTGHVAGLFEVILAQEEARLKQMEEWLKIRSESDKEQQRTGERTGRRGGQRDPRQSSLERLRGEVGMKKKAVAAWKENKDDIVAERVKELLQDHPNFPWGN